MLHKPGLKILHVLSQVQITGAEVYAVTLAEAHIQQGHEVFIISDKLHKQTRASYFSQPIHKRSYKQRLKNIFFLRNFLKQHSIDVVHAHSRAASWVCNIAVKNLKIPLISTIHGRQHLHASVSMFDIYGDKLIAVCNNLKEHLINEVKIDPKKVTTIPNGFDFSNVSLNKKTDDHTIISIIGRTSSKKGERTVELLTHVFPYLLKEIASFKIQIIGGAIDQLSTDGQQQLKELQAQYPQRIAFVGHVDNVPKWIAESDLVIGSGRVAIETLSMSKTLLALGEGCTHGIIHSENIDLAKASNFGDILATDLTPPVDYEKIKLQLENFLKKPTPTNAESFGNIKDYNINIIANQVLEVYKAERIKKIFPQFIPVLMYHKIPLAPIDSTHKIFVTKWNFEKHLSFFKKRSLSSITFQDYVEVRETLKPKHHIPERPIIISFDDGYTDNFFNALPLMQTYGYKGILYLLGDPNLLQNKWDADTEKVQEPLMSLEQKRVMVKAGWEIGAHSMTHASLPELSDEAITYEIVESKNRLEQDLGIKIYSFAYPYGNVNENVKSILKNAGIPLGIATDSGGMTIEEDLMQVFRINIFPNESMLSLYKKTSTWYRKYYKWKRKK